MCDDVQPSHTPPHTHQPTLPSITCRYLTVLSSVRDGDTDCSVPPPPLGEDGDTL